MPSRTPSPPPQSALGHPATVVRTLAREVWHEGQLRRPGEVVALRSEAVAVLEPEGVFTPLPSPQED